VDITPAEQEVLDQLLSSSLPTEEEQAKAEQATENRKVRQRRKMTASYKAHKALELLYPEQYEKFFKVAFSELGKDDRYAESIIS
jgi:hypothetical protein